MLEDNPSTARLRWSAAGSALVADALRGRGSLRLRVHGESMLPTLWPGEVVEIEGCPPEEVRPGEIVLARRDGRLFLHRLVAVSYTHLDVYKRQAQSATVLLPNCPSGACGQTAQPRAQRHA